MIKGKMMKKFKKLENLIINYEKIIKMILVVYYI